MIFSHGTSTPGALERLTPPWESVFISKQEPLKEGSRTIFYLKTGFIKIKWIAKHTDYMENRRFTDFQVRGPFSLWRHTHTFIPESGNSCFLEDRIRYRLILHPISRHNSRIICGEKAGKNVLIPPLITHDDIVRKQTRKPMNIALTGTSGFIAGHLVPYLSTQGHRITRLVRCDTSGDDEAFWDSDQGILDCSFDGTDAVIHLAGEPIGEGMWTEKKMKSIMESRVAGTRLIAEKLAAMDRPPATFICASAIGYYGNRGNMILSEDEPSGTDFISEVCREWELAAQARRGPGNSRGLSAHRRGAPPGGRCTSPISSACASRPGRYYRRRRSVHKLDFNGGLHRRHRPYIIQHGYQRPGEYSGAGAGEEQGFCQNPCHGFWAAPLSLPFPHGSSAWFSAGWAWRSSFPAHAYLHKN